MMITNSKNINITSDTNVKSFPSHLAHISALISDPVDLSQAPAEAEGHRY